MNDEQMVTIKTDVVTVSDMMAPKAQFTQMAQFFTNQDVMIVITWRVTQIVQVLVNQTNLSLLTSINVQGTTRPIQVIMFHTSETEMILKRTVLIRDTVNPETDQWSDAD